MTFFERKKLAAELMDEALVHLAEAERYQSASKLLYNPDNEKLTGCEVMRGRGRPKGSKNKAKP